MKNLYFLVIALLLGNIAVAQTYSFTALGGTFTANSGGTVLHNASIDDAISTSTPIGFNFVYGCDTYTTFSASTNGWMGLGSAAYFSNTFNNLNTVTERPVIAPLWDDIETSASGNVNYRLTGVAPNRVLTVEWLNMHWDFTATNPVISFQVKLYETTNRIEFIYRQEGAAVVPGSASIGLALATSGQFYSLNNSSASPTVSTVTETTNIVTKPATGQIYRFDNTTVFCSGTPTGGTASASLNPTTCATTATTLTATGMSTGCGIAYQWQSSTDNVTFTNIVGANSSTYAANNTANTYYRLVTTCTGSGISTNGASVLVNFSGTTPSNDLPCNATAMTIGQAEPGNNTCSGNTSEPATPSCWSTGNVNSVWYTFVASNANMTVKSQLGTIPSTQIAVFSGTCGALTMIAGACNQDEGTCGSTTMQNSLVNLTGLTVGTTYFIEVDGEFNDQGTFSIMVNPTGTAFPASIGQDCISPLPVCASSLVISDPGYQGIGNFCDIPSSYCLASAERGSVWYQFTTNAAGNIVFDIIPNNWPGGASTTGADYDFAIWKFGGAVTCASILGGTSTPLRCNYSGLGYTGLNGTVANTAPAAVSQFNSAYETRIACAAGETYYLLINNHSTSTDGFTINFLTSPINYTGAPTTVAWTGGASTTAWDNATNWGSCAFPVCGVNAVVQPFVFQPTVTGTKSVRDITINPGATLTLAAGSTLEVCGNFVNYGTINADPTSTVVMMGGANQTMTGSFIGTNAFGNLTINKGAASGTVTTNDDITCKSNFLTNNGTSIFNSNNKYIRVGGNFTNNNGNTTYTNTGTLGTLEFNGTGAQTYNQGASQLDLNNVVMNHTGTNVVLATNMFIKATTGTLTLTLGRIQTNANRVDVANSANASVSVGNASSYVFGNLYRTLNGVAGAYDFPLGTASLYERATINFTTATTIPRLQSRFDVWGTPALHTNGMSECATTYNIADENMGFWTINASANPTSGTYNTTLYCNGATNTAGVSGWTVEKSSDAGVTWVLSGTCDASSTAAIVKRNGMNGFSIFAAAQATLPLPIELLGFSGYSVGRVNELNWTTQTENNSDYFEVQRSEDGNEFYTFDKIAAAGNSVSEKNYNTTDVNPYFPITYYRLRQVDLDGKESFSPVITIESTFESDLLIHSIFPNPSSEETSIEFSQRRNQDVAIKVYNLLGVEIFNDTYKGLKNNIYNLNCKDWTSGFYLITLVNEEGVSAQIRFEKK